MAICCNLQERIKIATHVVHVKGCLLTILDQNLIRNCALTFLEPIKNQETLLMEEHITFLNTWMVNMAYGFVKVDYIGWLVSIQKRDFAKVLPTQTGALTASCVMMGLDGDSCTGKTYGP